ncbi:MAG: PQQ-binding-like beta-propeller repeat protein [Acidobacteriia bacterium]|nr:PQQ-binding-like beta-propeller repeat protein [Terriglobia bacterium]
MSKALSHFSALAILLVMAASPAAQSAPDSGTAMFRANPQHTGTYDEKAKYPAQKERWRFKTGNVNRSTPAVAGGVVYFGSHTGYLYAVDAATGALKWKFETPGEISSSPAVGEGTVFVNNDAGFWAVDAQTGRQKWMLKTGEPVAFNHRWDYFQSSPTYVGGTVYFGSADSYIYAVGAADGKVLWKYKTEGRVRASPAFSDSVLFTGSMDGNLYALDAKRGQLKWKFKTQGNAFFPLGEVQSTPAVADHAVFFGSRDGFLYAVDAATGEKRWAYSHEGSWCISGPAVWEGLVFVGSSDGQFVDAVDAKTGVEKWRQKMTARVFTSGAVADGLVYFGTWGGEVMWFDAATGKPKGGAMAEAAVQASPVLADGVLYFGSDDGYLYAVELEAPKQRQAITLDPKVLDAYVGEYEMMPGQVMAVTREGEKLMAQMSGQPKVELLAESESRFFITEAAAEFEFVKDASGQCTEVVLRQSGFEFTLKKIK